ncbi:hypothetical protein CLHOM_33640 [Clostridium homopropionicum DSM 5847]|uniref:Uncharacterized protein n=1 Tax=Clostridium homopropionicum DSM 5847 TaxID=1121318 RepID=A0A0L6Z666_9CLOT|nr:hypothetical protein [Clostridium homopropionicum]KOA18462.1 hypothetical protein CLHOM_33640 [Clostridium homopropionicum DSM 5847]SFF66368.1 hypothetical protein SAMN04488501_101116 [Clostridium homopropionicum]
MRISSNYYNYYNQLNSANSISKQTTSSEESSSSESIVDVISSSNKRKAEYKESGSITDLDFSVRKLMHDMKMQDNDTSEISESMNKIKEDMDAIKIADIDSMSTDELKTTLTNLITDMQSMPRPNDDLNDNSEISLDNMSEADMREMLKDIQERANNAPEHKPELKPDDAFDKIKADMDEIKTTDIDSLSTDELKETLANLIDDINSVRKPHGGYNNNLQINLDNISEEDMRDMLQKIQDNAE